MTETDPDIRAEVLSQSEDGQSSDEQGHLVDCGDNMTTAAAAGSSESPAPKRLPKAKAKGRGKGGGRPSKVVDGKKWCRAHKKYHLLECFPEGSANCNDGKRAVQNIQAAAKAAGRMDWWNETFADDMKLAEAVQYYEDNCAPAKTKSKQGTKNARPEVFPVVQYMETKKESQSRLSDNVYTPMDLLQFTSWKAKPKNGSLDAMLALTEFDALCQDRTKFYDNNGKHPIRKERVLVLKEELVIDRNKKGSSRSLTLGGKEEKNVKNDKVMQYREEFSKGGLKYNKEELPFADDLVKFAKSASQTSGQLSMDAKAITNLDMDDIMMQTTARGKKKRPADEIDSATEEHDADMEDGAASHSSKQSKTTQSTCGGNKGKGGKLPKKESYFDAGTKIPAAESQHATFINNIRISLQAELETARKLQTSLATSDDHVKQASRKELLCMQERVQLISFVLGATSNEFHDPLELPSPQWSMLKRAKSFAINAEATIPEAPPPAELDTAAAKHDESDETVAAAALTVKGPESNESPEKPKSIGSGGMTPKKKLAYYLSTYDPEVAANRLCRLCNQLVVLDELSDIVSKKIADSKSKEDLNLANAYMKPFKAAYDDIRQMTKAASARLARSMRAQIDRNNAMTTASEKNKGNATLLTGPGTSCAPTKDAFANFDSWHGIGSAVKTVQLTADFKLATESDRGKVSLEVPTIFRVPLESEFLKSDGEAVKVMTVAARCFLTSPQRGELGREQRCLKDDLANLFQKAIEDLVVECVGSADTAQIIPLDEKLKSDLSATSFAIAKNVLTVSMESGGAASLRLTHQGTRKVVLFPAKDVATYISKTCKKNLAGKSLYNHVKFKFTAEILKQCMAESTTGKCFECTVGPADALFIPPCWLFAERAGNLDTSGMRGQFIALPHEPTFEDYRGCLLQAEKENAVLEKVLRALYLAS